MVWTLSGHCPLSCCYGRVADCVDPELTSRAASGLGLDLDCLSGFVCPNARYG